MTENIEKPPVVGLKRIVTAICDHLPSIGKIRQHDFTTNFGAGVVFTKANECRWNGFYIQVKGDSPIWTASELRELAAECVEMANYLEKTEPPTPTA